MIVKAQDRLDTYTEAGEYAEGRIESADRLLQAADSREKEVAKVEKEALDRINNASISFLAKKEVERLAKENAELKLLVSGNATALEREAAATRHEKAGREKAERELQHLKETVSGTTDRT